MRIYRDSSENMWQAIFAIFDFLIALFRVIRKKSIDAINKIKQDRAAKDAAERNVMLK